MIFLVLSKLRNESLCYTCSIVLCLLIMFDLPLALYSQPPHIKTRLLLLHDVPIFNFFSSGPSPPLHVVYIFYSLSCINFYNPGCGTSVVRGVRRFFYPGINLYPKNFESASSVAMHYLCVYSDLNKVLSMLHQERACPKQCL